MLHVVKWIIFLTDSLSKLQSSFSWAQLPHWTLGCQNHHCHTETHTHTPTTTRKWNVRESSTRSLQGALRVWERRTVPSLLWVGLWSADAHWSSAIGSASVLTSTPENKNRNVTYCMWDAPAQTHTDKALIPVVTIIQKQNTQVAYKRQFYQQHSMMSASVHLHIKHSARKKISHSAVNTKRWIYLCSPIKAKKA